MSHVILFVDIVLVVKCAFIFSEERVCVVLRILVLIVLLPHVECHAEIFLHLGLLVTAQEATDHLHDWEHRLDAVL